MSSYVVAARCPTCTRLVEAETRGKLRLVWPLPQEIVELHAACDLRRLYNELSQAARELSTLMED